MDRTRNGPDVSAPGPSGKVSTTNKGEPTKTALVRQELFSKKAFDRSGQAARSRGGVL